MDERSHYNHMFSIWRKWQFSSRWNSEGHLYPFKLALIYTIASVSHRGPKWLQFHVVKFIPLQTGLNVKLSTSDSQCSLIFHEYPSTTVCHFDKLFYTTTMDQIPIIWLTLLKPSSLHNSDVIESLGKKKTWHYSQVKGWKIVETTVFHWEQWHWV